MERFTIRPEVVQRRPIYRLYKEVVWPKVAGTARWIEEPLGVAVVRRSEFIKSRIGGDWTEVRELLDDQFRLFPPGYRHFRCRHAGGMFAAYKPPGAQIVTGQEQNQGWDRLPQLCYACYIS